jgi:hypothetical protein
MEDDDDYQFYRDFLSDEYPEKIYVFSNVAHTAETAIPVNSGDLLIFLNKAKNIGLYKDHLHKQLYHRAAKPEYGKDIDYVDNFYVFAKDDTRAIPKSFIDELKRNYDWNYTIEKGKAKSMTTGYTVVKYMQAKYPKSEIILVDFGYKVPKSTYRCPWHNWKYEDEQLSTLKHIYTTTVEED